MLWWPNTPCQRPLLYLLMCCALPLLQGELGDSTSVLSKEWQALTPRANSCASGGSWATLQHACLDGLLDGIAELSTCGDADGSVHSGGSVGGGGLPGFAGSPGSGGTGGSPFGVQLKPCGSPPRACSRQPSGLQVQCCASFRVQMLARAKLLFAHIAEAGSSVLITSPSVDLLHLLTCSTCHCAGCAGRMRRCWLAALPVGSPQLRLRQRRLQPAGASNAIRQPGQQLRRQRRQQPERAALMAAAVQ